MKLILENGKPNFGIFKQPLVSLNHWDFKPQSRLSIYNSKKPKRWFYQGFVTPGFVVGCAVVNLNYVSNCFFYLFDRVANKLDEFNFLSPLGKGTVFQGNSVSGLVEFQNKRVHLKTIFDNGSALTELNSDGISLNAEITPAENPMAIVSRIGYAGYNYTVKAAGLPAHGEITRNGDSVPFGAGDSFAVIDYTLGVLAHETFWNWASGGGTGKEGARLGINLVRGINDTGETENAVWVDGTLVKIDNVNFIYDDSDFLKPWAIKSQDGKVDLQFTPDNMRKDDTSILGIIESRFKQPFGRFSGSIRDDIGRLYELDDFYGFVEEHFAKW